MMNLVGENPLVNEEAFALSEIVDLSSNDLVVVIRDRSFHGKPKASARRLSLASRKVQFFDSIRTGVLPPSKLTVNSDGM